MNRKISWILCLSLLIFASQLLAQNTHTISGYVKDKQTGELLVSANIFSEKYNKGITTDANGYYSITLPEDSISVVCSYFGYSTQCHKILLNQDIQIDIFLETEVAVFEEIKLELAKDSTPAENEIEKALESTQMSSVKLTTIDAKLLPAFMGEVDLLKSLQLKPGIQAGEQGSFGFYVRGGSNDQNLILLDKATVYNASHLFGFFSVFNSDAVKEVELFKGGFPAEYGGRLSSVIDVKTNDGNKTKFSGAGGIGLIATRLTLSGPIKKGKSSFIISGRRTYFDVFTRMLNRAYKNNPNFDPIPDYYFYDLNGKINYDISEKDKISLSGYYGKDIFGFNKSDFDFDFNWGNTVSSLKWDHLYNSKLSSNISLSFSNYHYKITNSVDAYAFNLSSKIRDYNIKLDYVYSLNNKHKIKFGGHSTYHQLIIGRLKGGSKDGKISMNAGQDLNGTDFAVYVADDYAINSRWKANVGLRYSAFIYKEKYYNGLEPRLSLRYRLNEKISLKASYARMYQYLHLITNSGASLPTDIWYPSTEKTRPQLSDQVATGINISLFNDNLFLTDEVYYKWMQRQVDLKDGAQVFANPNLEDDFISGHGWGYGNEIYLEKKKGKTTGWIGYTLSWTWRQFDEINNGNKFPAKNDRRHDISLVVIHQLSKRINISGTWVYGTGNTLSLAVGRFAIMQPFPGTPTVVPEYLERNSFRMPPYHRLDLNLTYKFHHNWGESDLTFSIYNVYSRRNPYFIYYKAIADSSGNTIKYQAKQVALFPIIPSITYNFKF